MQFDPSIYPPPVLPINFTLYISVPLLIGTARGGRIWPGRLTPLSARGFLVYLDQFNFQAQPGGLIYIGTYLSAIIISGIAIFTNRSRHGSRMPEKATGSC